MLSTRKINSPKNLDQFADLYLIESMGHKPVETDYLRNCHVRVFYYADAPDKWLAGYVINTQAPYRYFSVLDQDLKRELLLEHDIKDDEIAEVTCIWIKSKAISPAERRQVYFKSMLDALMVGKSFIFGGSTEPKVVALQQRIMPHDFANGVAVVGDEETDYWIYYVRRIESIFTMVRFVVSEYAKQFSRTKRKTVPPATYKKEEERVK